MNIRGMLAGAVLVSLSVGLGGVGCTAPETGSSPAISVTTSPAALTPRPVGLEIASIGVHTDQELIPLGLDDFRRLQVPDAKTPEVGGWFAAGVRPGDPGPAVIAAHVDGGGRPGLFARLHEVKPGDEIVVTRADGSRVKFTATRTEQYSKQAFPTAAVYGDIPAGQNPAQLRAITCGGDFDPQARSHVDNIVVYADLTATENPSDGAPSTS